MSTRSHTSPPHLPCIANRHPSLVQLPYPFYTGVISKGTTQSFRNVVRAWQPHQRRMYIRYTWWMRWAGMTSGRHVIMMIGLVIISMMTTNPLYFLTSMCSDILFAYDCPKMECNDGWSILKQFPSPWISIKV